MRFLVTGGAGFIGSAYVRGILNREYTSTPQSVVVLDSLTYAGNMENLAEVISDPRLRFVKGDICDQELVGRIMSEIDIVVNFAAESHVDRSITNPRAFIDTNVTGTSVLLSEAIRARVTKFVQISTDEVYGSISEGSWTESSILEPNSPYSASKAAADQLVRGFCRTYGLNYNITRCSNNYGPFQNPEKLIPLFITNLIQNTSVPIYGTGTNMREWIHVEDHCRGIDLVVNSGKSGEIYNIGGGQELSNISITKKLLSMLSFSETMINFVEDRKNHDFRYSIDDSKIRNDLRYQPAIDFEAGLVSTINWYRQNDAWWLPLKNKLKEI